jgi:hypothetical protein
MLSALSSRSTLSALVGALLKKFGFFLNTPRMFRQSPNFIAMSDVVK